MSSLNQVDHDIRGLVRELRAAGMQTDWSCSGEPGHMVIRPTVQMRTIGDLVPRAAEVQVLLDERRAIEAACAALGLTDYWLLLNFAAGGQNTHGGEPTWLLMLPGRYDTTTALPVAYDARFQTPEQVYEGHVPPPFGLPDEPFDADQPRGGIRDPAVAAMVARLLE